MPLVFSTVEPWIAKGMLSVAAVLLIAALVLWAWGRERAKGDAGQATNGPHSPNFGTVHGNVTIGATPAGDAQVAKAPYDIDALNRGLMGAIAHTAKPKRPMEISDDIIRATKGLHPLKPDYPLKALGETVRASFADPATDRAINIEIADWAVRDKISVWARIGDFALKRISNYDLTNTVFDFQRGTLRVAGEWGSTEYSDVKVSKEQVDQQWL